MNAGSPPPLRLDEVAERLDGALEGPPDLLIRGVSEPANAGPDEIVILSDKRRLREIAASRAGAVVTRKGWDVGRPAIRVREPRLALADLIQYFHPAARPSPGVHPTATLGSDVVLGKDVSVRPGVVLEDGVRLGDRAVLYPNVYVGAGSRIGEDTLIYPNVSIYRNVEIGRRVIIHSNATLGSDGYGFVPLEDGTHRKIPHVGRVIIEDDVEIGANAAVDRATLGETRIGRGTKIDNLVQVAHNVHIGENCIIVGQVGMAGSSSLGSGVILAARSGVGDHTHVGDKAILTAMTLVNRDIPPGTTWAAARVPRPAYEHGRVESALGKVPAALKSLKSLEDRMANIEKFLERENR